MTGCSDQAEEALSHISFAGISALIEIVSESDLRSEQYIRAKYVDRATYFDATLAFLLEIKCIKNTEGQLAVEKRLSSDRLSDGRPILDQMVASGTSSSEILAHYLARFETNCGQLEYQPDEQQRLQETGIRDLLMQMRIIDYAQSTGTYRLGNEFADLYLWAKNEITSRKQSAAQNASQRRHQLGAFAEQEIVKFERRRVGPGLANEVQHISAANSYACYDIKSVTVSESGPISRFIEVKAVSEDSYEFFWTGAEIEAASLLRGRYFLYLIPVVNAYTLDFNRLLIIADAYETLRDPREGWEMEEDVVVCRKAPPPKI